MLYAVGPKGEGCTGPRRKGEAYLNETAFTSMLKRITNNLVQLINQHNKAQLMNHEPLITNVRWCLLSGGSYRHKKISKIEVAKTICNVLEVAGFVGKVEIVLPIAENSFQEARPQEYKRQKIRECNLASNMEYKDMTLALTTTCENENMKEEDTHNGRGDRSR